MSAKAQARFGHAVPNAPRHSVTVQMPTWESVEAYGADSSSVISTFRDGYPRMKPHPDIASLSAAVLKSLEAGTEKSCFLFSSIQSAQECLDYSTSPRRDNGVDKTPVTRSEIHIHAFLAKDKFFAVVFPLEKHNVVKGFWSTPGCGVSSRFAESNLQYQLTEVELSEELASRPSFETPAHDALRDRIITHVNRASLSSTQRQRPSRKDVYFYPTGMASIYKPHSYLVNLGQGTTVLFGQAFMNTLNVFQDFGHSFKLFGLGTDDELYDLEAFLEEERRHGRKVSAIWAEFPANPILVTPNVTRLRYLADEYETILAIDDTIGGFANIDVMPMSDILITSLTKSFSGYADVIAGSAILNPSSRKYDELKYIFDKHYVPELYITDAEVLECNSRDFLVRTDKHNNNALALVKYLQSLAEDPDSAIVKVFYPAINASGIYYKKFMKSSTPEFIPGYGCLFSIEFSDLSATRAFYDSLNIYKGPHLGAPMTLMFAYTMCAYATKLDWAAQFGLKPTQLRIAAGLEDCDELVREFKIAAEAATQAKV